MKTSIIILPLLLLICILISNCGNNTTNPTNSPNGADTSTVNYIILTPTSGSADTLFFTDREHCTGSYSSIQNNTYCLMNDTTTHNSSSVTFDGNAIGSPAFTFGFISYNGNSLMANSVSGTVTLYESIGGKIKGTFSGSYSSGSTNYSCKGEFTVKRTQ